MASAAVDHHHKHLHLESIPVVDLRLFSQPELLSLSYCSSSPSLSNAETELFTPKIDRSVFNESAGSRKQTFYRLRFGTHPHHSSPSSTTFPFSLRQNPEPLDEESSDLLPLLKSLFNIDDSVTPFTNEPEPIDDKDLWPVQIEYRNENSALQNSENIPVGTASSSGSKRKRGRPRREDKDNWGVESKVLVVEEKKEVAALDRVNEAANAGDICGGSEIKRRRGRPRKEESQSVVIKSEVLQVESEELEREALKNVEEILGIEEELRKRTEGLTSEEELLDFMRGCEGEWASKSQKKRIVDASSFRNVLPEGWKVMLFVKRRAGLVWLACSRYIRYSRSSF